MGELEAILAAYDAFDRDFGPDFEVVGVRLCHSAFITYHNEDRTRRHIDRNRDAPA